VPKLRVGIVNYLNSRPLAWGFLQGKFAAVAEAVYHPPARVAELLASGDLDVGLIPSIEYQRIPELSIIPELCVAATAEVRSVLLICNRPLEEVECVALDLNSRTSAALVKILLDQRFGVIPKFTSMGPNLERMLEGAQAALIIGDPALEVDRERYRVYDLAAEWRELTGKPFVFAVWAVRSDFVLSSDLGSIFAESLQIGLEQIEVIVTEAAAEMGLPETEVADYLTHNLSYGLGDLELQGLQEFFQRAHGLELIDEVRSIEFTD
jgi:chorismate dehydratase